MKPSDPNICKKEVTMSCRDKTGLEIFAVLLTAFALSCTATTLNAGQSSGIAGIDGAYWQQQADYEIHVRLDTEEHILTGSEKITYKNNSPDTLDLFHLHLYPNAYREKTSPLIRDYMPGTLYFIVGLTKGRRSWIDITEFKVNGKETEFSVEGTILTSSFPEPLTPGRVATIELSFEEKIRPKLGRAGYAGRHYDMAQWYPKMVVYDKNGWHPDQFRKGEFYGEFGTFDVHIKLPEEYVIAATGDPVSGDPGWDMNASRHGGPSSGGGGGHGGDSGRAEYNDPTENPGGSGHAGSPGLIEYNDPPVDSEGSGHGGSPGLAEHNDPTENPGDGRHGVDTTAGLIEPGEEFMKTVHFHAERVHDFAWVADPTFVVQDTTYNGYRIMSFYQFWNTSWTDSALVRGIRAMKWLERIAGPYPYSRISIAASPGHGGMEYPMLVINSTAEEGLIFHELGHSYFYGILANDEREEAWLDEGFTQYQTFWFAGEHYGPYGESIEKGFFSSLYPRAKMWEGITKPVIRLHRTGFVERVATPHHELKNNSRVILYLKAPLFLRALHYTVGDETFRRILHTYFDRWKFKHVDEEAFYSVCEEVSGMDLSGLFKQWLHSTKGCDYKIGRFEVEKTDAGYKTDIKIERKDELIMPLALAFRLENGNTVTERVDGLLRTIEKSFNFDVRPVSVAINPGNEIMDIYMIDNFSPRRRDISLDLPFRTYYPQDAYEFRVAPTGFYNDVDGGKAGLRLRGSYDNTYRKFTLQGLYGFESEKTDIYGSFEHPLKYLGRDASVEAEGYSREGRRGASLTLNKIRRKYLSSPLAQYISVNFTYQELIDTSYVYPYTYEEGINLKGGLRFSLYPKTDLFATSLSFDLNRSSWGSDFNYERSTLEARLWPARRYPLPVKPSVRFFLGYSSIDPPLQEMFNLAGAGVLDRERYFWLRSVGAFPKDHYSNFHVPGNGNLRGYYNGDFCFRRLFASNIEMSFPLPLPLGKKLSRIIDRKLYMFFDWGRVFDQKPLEGLPPTMRGGFDEDFFNDVIYDFGVGISIWRITAEFPFYISHPKLTGDEEKWDLRWTIGINRLF